MSRLVLALAAALIFAVGASTAQAAVTVTQDGGDLYIVGDDSDDSVYVDADFSYYYYDAVYVYDYQTGEGGYYYGVDTVWVDTGNGDDDVEIYCAYDAVGHVSTGNGEDYVWAWSWGSGFYGGLLTVDTGNGADDVDLYAYFADVDVSTGNGEDYVYTWSYGSADYNGEVAIDTGNADDVVALYANPYNYYFDGDNLAVTLGRGDDTIYGYANYCDGTIDGGKGDDSCSGLYVYDGTLEVINCED